jgi:hypothetical protein
VQVLLDALKGAAPLLAVLLPFLAAYFAYRHAGRQPASIGSAGLISIAGGLSDRASAEHYVEKIEDLIEAIKKLAHAEAERAEALREARQNDRLVDTLIEIRRCLEDMSAAKLRSGRIERGERGTVR